MAFFDQIKDMAKAAAVKSEEFAKTVGKKAEAAMDMQKLASDIEKKERFIKDNYMQMGMEVYQKADASDDIPEYLQEYCKLIDATKAEIDELQTKIDMIKQAEFGASPAKVTCSHCGAEVLASSKFCPECGGALKQENAAKEDEAKQAVTDEAENAESAETDKAKQSDSEVVEENKAETASEAEAAKEAEVVEGAAESKSEPIAEAAITDAEIVEPQISVPKDAEVKEQEVKNTEDASKTAEK